MEITGACHCGSISYRAEADPQKTLICHCTDCQVMSGSAYRTIIFVRENQFELLSGQLKTYIKTADSGNRRAMMFCPDCGTQIYATSVDTQDRIFGVRLGTTHQRTEIKPRQQYYVGSKLDWVHDLDSIETI